MQKPSLQALTLLLASSAVFFTGLGQSRLWDRDEPRNAGCAAEMMARGDYVVPIFNDQLRQQKPVLLYWLMISAYQFLGVSEFAARFWSAALAVISVLCTWQIGRRLYGDAVGWLAGIALATSLMFVVAARAATPDSVLIACVTAALAVYVQATFARDESSPTASRTWRFFPSSWGSILAFYGLLGLAVLAKGPVGFLLPMATIGLFGMIEAARPKQQLQGAAQRRQHLGAIASPINFWRTLWQMKPVVGAIVVLLVAGPWFIGVHWRTDGDFSRLFFLSENLGRATAPMENHTGGLWFYPLAILIGFFPWSCFWGPTALTLWRGRGTATEGATSAADLQRSRANTLLLCWIGIQVGAFSLAQTKLPSYVTPCYPALALLTAHCLVTAAQRRSSPAANNRVAVGSIWIQLGLATVAVSGLGILTVGYWALGRFLPNQTAIALVGIIPLVGGGLMMGLWASRRQMAVLPGLAIIGVLFAVGLFGWGTTRLDQEQRSHQILQPVRDSDLPVATWGCLESSWVFYSGKPITELNLPAEPPAGEFPLVRLQTTAKIQLTSHRSNPVPERENFWEPLPRMTLDQWLGQNPRSLVIATDENWEALRQRLPPNYVVLRRAPYFLKPDRTLLLVGPRDSDVASVASDP